MSFIKFSFAERLFLAVVSIFSLSFLLFKCKNASEEEEAAAEWNRLVAVVCVRTDASVRGTKAPDLASSVMADDAVTCALCPAEATRLAAAPC